MSERRLGLRLSGTDAAFLAGCGLFGFGLRPWLLEFSWLALVAAGHFFLFCNVFRVRRSLELWWSAGFLLNFLVALYGGCFAWSRVLLLQTPVTLLVLALELRSARYHGVFARRINRAHADDWLAGRID